MPRNAAGQVSDERIGSAVEDGSPTVDDGGSTGRRSRARRGDGERLRAEIVDAASELLAITGEVGELSLRAVARAVGVATTSIYLHFGNIDDLVLAVKVRYFEEFGAVLQAAAEAAGSDPVRRVRARGHAYVGYGLAQQGRYKVMFSSRMLPKAAASTLSYIGVEVFEALRGDVATAIGTDENAALLAVHLWTSLHGAVMLRSARRNFPWPDLDHEVDDLTNRMLHRAG